MRDRARIKQIADWIGTMDWIATAPVFLVWCGDMRRGQRLCEMHDMPHANNNMDTFLNTAVDCTLAMAAVHGGGRRGGTGHLPDQLRPQPYRARIAPARPALRRLSGGRPDRRLAGVSPPGIDAAATRRSWCIANVTTTARWRPNSPATTSAANDRDPVAAGSLKNNDVYPPRDGVGWSENAARQLSVPERFGFSTYLKTKGFDLA